MSPALLVRAGCAIAAAVTALVVAPPAFACSPPTGGACGDTTVTATLTAGSLALSVPSSVSIGGTLGSASSFSTTMGTIQVQDSRGSLGGWTLTALTSGDLTTGGATPSTISLGTSGSGGPLTLSTGTVTPVGISSLVNVTAGAGGSLNPSQPVTVARALTGFGGGTYTMTPTLQLTPPANVVAGVYTTTIVFSLS